MAKEVTRMCDNCEFDGHGICSYPCSECDDHSMHAFKTKCCEKCKYYNLEAFEQPCIDCGSNCNAYEEDPNWHIRCYSPEESIEQVEKDDNESVDMIDRKCSNCEYSNLSCDRNPCNSCSMHSMHVFKVQYLKDVYKYVTEKLKLNMSSNESSNPYYEDDPGFSAKCDCKVDESCEADKPCKAEADVVNHPSHYETGKFECIKVMEEAIGREEVKGFCICNAFKYLYRCRRKNGLEDIKKAKWYIDKFIELCDEDAND